MDSLALILILPLLGALVLFLSPKNYAVLSGLHVLFSAATSVALLNNVLKVLSSGTFYSFDKFLFLDSWYKNNFGKERNDRPSCELFGIKFLR